MKQITCILVLIFIVKISFASEKDFLEFGDTKFAKESLEESKWLIRAGAEYVQYPSSLPEFSGQHESISPGDKDDIWGFGIGVGREFYIGKGVSTTVTLGGMLHKTLDRKVGKAAEDIDIDIASVRTGHYYYAYEGAVSLNYVFDNKLVDIQPFVEVGAGLGHAEVEKEYTRKSISVANEAEEYDVVTKEDFTFSRVAIGVNFVGYKGIMSYIKVSSMMMAKNSRKTSGQTNAFGSTVYNDVSSEEKDLSETETVTTASIGMGYFF